MQVLYPRCCALDVHKETVVACLRLVIDDKVVKEVRTFETTEAVPIRQTTRRPDQAWLYCCQAASFFCCCCFCFFVGSVERCSAPAYASSGVSPASAECGRCAP